MKEHFKENALAIFVMPPSFEELEQRLRSRGTESEEKIQMRLSKSKKELESAPKFDIQLLNEDLNRAFGEAISYVNNFID